MGRTIDDNRLIKQGGQFLIGTSEKKDRNIFFWAQVRVVQFTVLLYIFFKNLFQFHEKNIFDHCVNV